MVVHKLLLHEAIGETRAVALDAAGRPIGLFQTRWAEQGVRLAWGEVHSGTIRKVSPHDGGAFIALEGGQEGFLPRRDMTGMVEGAHGLWRIQAEARLGKLAKLAAVNASDTSNQDALARWRASLPEADAHPFETSDEAARTIDAVFEDALNPIAPLAGGGRLQITPTPALVAIDVDTVGRRDKGRASARAKAVGLVSAEEAARQAHLRGLGGAIVIDCIGPLARRDGPELKKKFVTTMRAMTKRRVECLPPSPFGLMEAVLEWRWQPLHETYLDKMGRALPLAVLLDGLRQIERAAIGSPADRLLLELPDAAFEAFNADKTMYETALTERFGARIDIRPSRRDKIEISSL